LRKTRGQRTEVRSSEVRGHWEPVTTGQEAARGTLAILDLRLAIEPGNGETENGGNGELRNSRETLNQHGSSPKASFQAPHALGQGRVIAFELLNPPGQVGRVSRPALRLRTSSSSGPIFRPETVAHSCGPWPRETARVPESSEEPGQPPTCPGICRFVCRFPDPKRWQGCPRRPPNPSRDHCHDPLWETRLHVV